MRFAHLDYETFSEADLPKVGHYRYAEDPSTEILLCAYQRDEWPEPRLWAPLEGEPLPDDLADILDDHETLIVAWNAAFERAITRNCLPEYEVPVTRWRCAMVDAMAVGFPGKLETVGPALGLDEALFKQEGGRRLINKFCKPRKPTKKNPATRWTPGMIPTDWALFKAYCLQDVVAETAVWNTLATWRLPPIEQQLWELDQEINDRGIHVDLELAVAAHRMGLEHRARLVERAKEITGLDNPNSVQQLVTWLNEQPDFDPDEDTAVADLRKKTVEKMLGREDLTEVVRQVLELRQQIAKSSLKKYETIIRATCADGRIRGTMQFYGANRTGRWAGRLLQVQNLPQGIIEDVELLAIVRELVRAGDYDSLVWMFGVEQIPNILATLIRTCLVAAPGTRLVVADLSAIEARVIAWFAQCKWRLDVFKTHGKIYEASAATAFGLPLSEILDYKKRTGKHHPLRKKGKVIELACIAEGQLVLTDVGLVRIEEVTTRMRVWDGYTFVPHRGVIYRGTKEVIEYDGLTATEDHIVWTGTGPEEFGRAAARGARLLESGAGRHPVRVGGNRESGAEIHEGLEPSVRADEMRRVRSSTLAEFCQPEAGEIEGVPSLLPASGHSRLVDKARSGYEEQMREADEPGLRELRGSRNSVRVRVGFGSLQVDQGEPWSGSQQGAGSDRQQCRVQTRQPPVFDEVRKHEKPTALESDAGRRSMGEVAEPVWDSRNPQIFGSPVPEGGHHRSRLQGCSGQAEELAGHKGPPRIARVFDLVEAGPLNRFTVSGKLVHNCGYQGAANAMITMGALEQGLKLEELQPMVDAWRAASPEIAGTIPEGKQWPEGGLWRDVEAAAKKCLRLRTRQEAAGCIFRYAGGMLVITLPSGRHLHYVRAHLAIKDGRQQIAYMGVDQKTKRWGLLYTYGGKLCIAKGTPVLARRGWVPIQNILPGEEVWDGVEWVRQGGAIAKGRRDTIKAHGVRMTPDHEVLTEKGWIRASQSERYNRAACRIPDGYPVRWLGREEIPLGSDLHLRQGRLVARHGIAETSEARGHSLLRVPTGRDDPGESHGTRDVGAASLRGVAQHARSVSATHPSSLEELRRAWDYGMQGVGRVFQRLLGRHGTDLSGGLNPREDRQRGGVSAGELPLGYLQRASQQQAELSARACANGTDHRLGGRPAAGDSAFDFALQSEEVFDLLDCGPRHRFVVADEGGQPLIVHNCENIVQAFSRDILREILFRLPGYHPIMLVHDEGVFEEPVDHGSLEEVLVAMSTEVSYAPGLPLKGAGFENPFYYKD